MKIYIEFFNTKNYKIERKYFKKYENAVHWGKRSLHNFHIDMIKTIL